MTITLGLSAASPPFGANWPPSGRQDGMEQCWTGGHLKAIGGQCLKLHSVTRTQCAPCRVSRGSRLIVAEKRCRTMRITLHDTRWLAPEMHGHEMSLVRETLAHCVEDQNV